MAMLTIKNLNGKKAHFTKNGNTKLGSMWVWSTMKGAYDEIRYVNDFKGECSGTCGAHCECCTKSCYVNRSYRYGSVIKGHAVNTTWMKEDMSATFAELSGQLKRARKKPAYIRINQSGELMSGQELVNWVDLAAQYPNTQFYLYTKNYDAIEYLYSTYGDKKMPKNFTILISIWHDVGVKEFDKYKAFENIKAFVYDDGELSIKPQTYCMAYDDKGKMNHDITCDKCKKCFIHTNGTKIVGCKAH